MKLYLISRFFVGDNYKGTKGTIFRTFWRKNKLFMASETKIFLILFLDVTRHGDLNALFKFQFLQKYPAIGKCI